MSTYFNTVLSEEHGRDFFLGNTSEYEALHIAQWFFRVEFRFHRFPIYIDHDWDNAILMTFWQGMYILASSGLVIVAQLESVGMRHNGILVCMWVPRTHMIGPFHFWYDMRGEVGVHFIR